MSDLYLAFELSQKTKDLIHYETLHAKDEIAAEFENLNKYHITLMKLANDEKQAAAAIEALINFKSNNAVREFDVKLANYYTFNEKVLWMGVHDSLPLYDIHYAIKQELSNLNFEIQGERFKEYVPHVTIAYDVTWINSDFNRVTNPILTTIDNVSLWNGFKVNGQYIHNFIYKLQLN